MIRRAVGPALVALAIILAVVPMPADAVERWYSSGVYPHVQRTLTSASNLFPFSLFDVVWIGGVVAVVLITYRSIRARGWIRGAATTASRLLIFGATTYLIFLAVWGLNYRRVPLTDKLAFDRTRITAGATVNLANHAVSELNRLYSDAHGAPVTTAALADAFHDAQRALGERVPIVPGRPKQTLLGGYFHSAAISGMTDPFLLETMMAPDLLDVERPFVVAHEWGHLAGYADESEANFIAFVTCARAGPAAAYSGWLEIFGHAISAVGRGPARDVMKTLQGGPRADLLAIRERYARTSPVVREAAQRTYDRYLRANRVPEGIESYDQVLQLMLGTSFESGWTPRLRSGQ